MWFGLELALMGMTTVFVFLIILTVLTLLMSKTVGYFEFKYSKKMSDRLLKKIITAAIKEHRSGSKNYD